MSTEIEKLPKLLARAIATLEKATTAGEILEARAAADAAYTAAKLAARLTKVKDAHDTVLATCRKTMADALVIEARAQCRLADEYDAAQERGEIAKQETGRPVSVPNKNTYAKTVDVGLTRKQVHQARAVRNAEKAKPGIIRKTVEDRLEAGEEPTRADVKRAVKGDNPKSGGKNAGGGRKGTVKARNQTVPSQERPKLGTEVLDQGKTVSQVAKDHGVSVQIVKTSVEYEKGRRAAEPTITPDMLSMTQQQKNDAWRRQELRRMEMTFEQRVKDEIRTRMDEIILPHWKQQIEQAKTLYERRKALMDKETFNTIRRALHRDSRLSISDKKLDEAFNTFMSLEKYLINEKDSPTKFEHLDGSGVPSAWADWEKRDVRRTKKRGSKHPLERRSVP